MRLIVPMGGRGTRLRPFSHTTPKALLPLAGATVVERKQHAVRVAVPRPLSEVVFVLNPADTFTDVPERLAAACAREGLPVHIETQPEPLGTAHAIACAADRLDGEVVTVWSDTLFASDGAVDLEPSGAPVDLVAWTVEVDDPARFGVAVRDVTGRVVRLVEKPQTLVSRETLIGVYYVRDGAALRRQIQGMVERGETGAGGEYQLTDALDALVQGGAHVDTMAATQWLDTGTLDAYRDTLRAVLDAEGTTRDGSVEHAAILEPSYVGPGAIVRRSVVGPYAAIEPGAVVEDAVVARSSVFEGAEVRGVVLDGALVGEGARLAGRAEAPVLGAHSSG